MRLTVVNVVHLCTLLPFNQHLHRAIGQFEHLQDGRNAAHGKHVRDQRIIFGCGF
jgi:hypothetical protein